MMCRCVIKHTKVVNDSTTCRSKPKEIGIWKDTIENLILFTSYSIHYLRY